MRYLGSKTMLVQQIHALIGAYGPGTVLCDPFGGMGTVGSYMKQRGFQVICGDVLLFAHFFQKSLVEMDNLPDFSRFIKSNRDIEQYLNNVSAEDGWLIQEYCKNRKFFTLQNAKHIQGCIDTVWMWRANEEITEDEYAFLIASLIQAMDKVANTAGTYYAYLKDYYRKALQPFQFRFLPHTEGRYHCQCFLEDANIFVRNHPSYVLYLDPPYNEREYSRYYHLPETIARGIIPTPHGKSGIPPKQEPRSAYTTRSKVKNAFVDLIENCQSNVIIFHYADNGLMEKEFVKDVLYDIGSVTEYYFDCKGYYTKHDDKTARNQHHIYKVMI